MNPIHTILFRPAVALVVSLLLGGCATPSRFAVASVRREVPDTEVRSYRLAAGPSLAQAAAGPMLADLRTALSGRGLHQAPAGVHPDLEITVDLERGPATPRSVTSREPVYLVPSLAGLPGRPQAASSAILAPRALVHREVTQTFTVYPRMLHLTARVVDAPAGASPIWEVAVLHEGDSAEAPAREARWMVAAAMDWIDRESGGPAVVELRRGDARVAFLERGTDPTTRGLAARTEPERHPRRADG